MSIPCREMGLDELVLLAETISRNIETLKLSKAENHPRQLRSLKTTFRKGLAIMNTLINAGQPINRLPPEVLGHIFALVPTRRRSHRSFVKSIVKDLHALPKVCRRWRELALAMPTLWTTISTTYELGARGGVAHHFFRHSIYLHDDPSLQLSVDLGIPSLSGRMEETLLRNAPRIRELCYFDSSSGPDLPDFLQSFDANVLEKCSLSASRSNSTSKPPLDLTNGVFRPFFSGGGARLHTLYLNNFSVLPTNQFPALSRLILRLDFGITVPWNLWDLLKFLSGCPMLEDIHLCSAWFVAAPHLNAHEIKTPVTLLPRLRYLHFEYPPHMDKLDDAIQIINFLLSHIAIPSTCHFDFPNPYVPGESSSELNCATLDCIRHHVPNKDRVSHLALWLPETSSGERAVWLQLVFPEGSLRLLFQVTSERLTGSLQVDGLLRFLRAYPDTLASAADLRIYYSEEAAQSSRWFNLLMDALPAIFPNVKLMSTIVNRSAWYPQTCFEYLLPREPDQSPSGADVAAIPYPALDTVWVLLHDVEDGSDAAKLNRVLSRRAELGFPIRRFIIAYSIPRSQTRNGRRDGDMRSLRLALEGVVDEVVLMGIPPRETPEEYDWMVWYPEKYELPADVRRDWPVWG